MHSALEIFPILSCHRNSIGFQNLDRDNTVIISNEEILSCDVKSGFSWNTSKLNFMLGNPDLEIYKTTLSFPKYIYYPHQNHPPDVSELSAGNLPTRLKVRKTTLIFQRHLASGSVERQTVLGKHSDFLNWDQETLLKNNELSDLRFMSCQGMLILFVSPFHDNRSISGGE